MRPLQNFNLKLLLPCLFFLLFMPALFAQIGTEQNKESKDQSIIEDSFGRSTPRGSVSGFISSISDQNYELASQYLKLPKNTSLEQGKEMAKNFQKVLDLGDLISLSRISKDSIGKINDDLPANIDMVGQVKTESDTFDILVEKSTNEEGKVIWLFSSETMKMLSEIRVESEVFLINQILPESLENSMWRGVPVGHWLVALILIALAYLVAWAICFLVFKLISLIWSVSNNEPSASIIKAFTLPLRLYLAVWLYVIILQKLGISIILKEKLHIITLVVGIIAILMLFWRLNKAIGRYSSKKMLEKGNSSGVSIIMFLQRLFKAIILVIGFIIILYVIGVDVTAGLAALGIGGIALALGAQKSMENFVGSVTLIADQPIRVGDFCKVGEIKGTVEKIGMRSTRIRTSNRTVVTIPNGQFSSDSIENYAPRDMFLFDQTIRLRPETTPDQIRYLLIKLRTMVYAHPKLSLDPARVRFTELGPNSVNIEFYTYIQAANLNESLEVKEDLLLRIMDIVKESGTDFAYPSQTLYIARDAGVSEEKTKKAEEKVQKWREKNKLANPEFSPEHIEKVKDSIQYPPTGSETSETSESQGKLDIE